MDDIRQKLSELTYLELMAALYAEDAIDARFYPRSELEDTAELLINHGADFSFDHFALWSRVTNGVELPKISGSAIFQPIPPLAVVGTIVGFYPTTLEAKIRVENPSTTKSGEYVYIKTKDLIKYREEKTNEEDNTGMDKGRSGDQNYSLAPWVGCS